MLYLTSVLSEAGLSTAEEFAAGPAQFLGSWVISPSSLLTPERSREAGRLL